jgi:hypothetical protein
MTLRRYAEQNPRPPRPPKDRGLDKVNAGAILAYLIDHGPSPATELPGHPSRDALLNIRDVVEIIATPSLWSYNRQVTTGRRTVRPMAKLRGIGGPVGTEIGGPITTAAGHPIGKLQL